MRKDNNQRDPGFLYTGARLLVAEEWASLHRRDMNALECDFLVVSRNADQAQRDTALRAERGIAARG